MPRAGAHRVPVNPPTPFPPSLSRSPEAGGLRNGEQACVLRAPGRDTGPGRRRPAPGRAGTAAVALSRPDPRGRPRHRPRGRRRPGAPRGPRRPAAPSAGRRGPARRRPCVSVAAGSCGSGAAGARPRGIRRPGPDIPAAVRPSGARRRRTGRQAGPVPGSAESLLPRRPGRSRRPARRAFGPSPTRCVPAAAGTGPGAA